MTPQNVKGKCPACGREYLYLGAEGHITCPGHDCPNPCAADELLTEGPANWWPNPGDDSFTLNCIRCADAIYEGKWHKNYGSDNTLADLIHDTANHRHKDHA